MHRVTDPKLMRGGSLPTVQFRLVAVFPGRAVMEAARLAVMRAGWVHFVPLSRKGSQVSRWPDAVPVPVLRPIYSDLRVFYPLPFAQLYLLSMVLRGSAETMAVKVLRVA